MLLSPKQIEFVRCANHRWNFKGGATRSGKTYLDFKWIIPMRIRERVGMDGLSVILGVTKSTIERNVLEPMRNIYGDEVADWSEDVFTLLKSRLDKDYSCFDGTFNPQHPDHWLKQFLDSNADIFSQTYTIDDNPFLPEAFKENLKREYAGTVFYDRYILGLWTRAEGLVYPMFSSEKHIFSEHGTEGTYYVSMDYGTINPTAMGLWRLHNGKVFMEREYYHDSRKERRQKTDEEYYQDLVAFVGDTPIQRVIIDPSAASFKECIRRHGKFHISDADNSVLDGIRFTGTLIAQGRLKIHESCVSTIKEFGAYRWDEKAGQDAVIKENDHSMDQMRYFCQTMRRKLR